MPTLTNKSVCYHQCMCCLSIYPYQKYKFQTYIFKQYFTNGLYIIRLHFKHKIKRDIQQNWNYKQHTLMVCPIVKVGSSNNFSRDLNKLLSLIWFNLWRHSSAFWESEKDAAIFVNTHSICFSVSSAQISWKSNKAPLLPSYQISQWV